jgi:hypothetical protein
MEVAGRVADLEGIAEEMRDRLSRMTWMVGLSMAWNTLLTGLMVGIVLKYG